MPGRKKSPKHGMLKGKRPAKCIPFAKGDARTLAASAKGVKVRKELCARFKSLREAAIALRDLPSRFDPSMSNGVAAVAAMYEAAQAGNPKAATFLAQLQGEMVEKIDMKTLPVIRDDIPRAPDPVRVAPTEKAPEEVEQATPEPSAEGGAK